MLDPLKNPVVVGVGYKAEDTGFPSGFNYFKSAFRAPFPLGDLRFKVNAEIPQKVEPSISHLKADCSKDVARAADAKPRRPSLNQPVLKFYIHSETREKWIKIGWPSRAWNTSMKSNLPVRLVSAMSG